MKCFFRGQLPVSVSRAADAGIVEIRVQTRDDIAGRGVSRGGSRALGVARERVAARAAVQLALNHEARVVRVVRRADPLHVLPALV